MINFIKYTKLYGAISLMILVPGIVSLFLWGFKPSIDFVGGTVIEFTTDTAQKVSKETIEQAFQENDIDIESIRIEDTDVFVRAKPIERDQWQNTKVKLEGKEAIADATPSASSITELRFETVGPVIGKELLTKTMIAAAIAVLGILSYIAWAFKDIVYGVSAIVALFHDVLVVIGIFSLLGHFYGVEVDVLFVTAVLTTMSFSVHDTIVVFDRIRESLKTERLSFTTLVNKALTETMTRSLNNSMTIIFMLLSLALMGGETIRWFVVALLIGTISGTYSSPFVATPVLWLLKIRKEQ